jgi:NADPH:quinone reductase-like Zn-dependent oxidoreductase
MKTQAVVLKGKGKSKEAFEIREVELATIKSDEILIKNEAFGLNYADVMARNGLYKDAPPMPCVIGYESVGIVEEIGSEVDQSILGKRVLAFCRFGAYGRHVITKSNAAFEIGALPSQEVLALCTQAVTAYYMTDILSPIRKGDKVLVHAAAGGVGTILIQLAKRKGAIVIAKVGNAKKFDLVKELGADHVINYRAKDYFTELRNILKGDTIDISYNAVGGATFKKDWKLLGAGGRLFIFGGAALSGGKFGLLSALNFLRKMGLIIPAGLMMSSRSILGVNMLKIADHQPLLMNEALRETIQLYKNQKIKVCVGGVFPVSEIDKAHDLLESGNSTGKISIIWD